MKWIYYTHICHNDNEYLEFIGEIESSNTTTIDVLGYDGWELVSVNKYTFYFKREIEN